MIGKRYFNFFIVVRISKKNLHTRWNGFDWKSTKYVLTQNQHLLITKSVFFFQNRSFSTFVIFVKFEFMKSSRVKCTIFCWFLFKFIFMYATIKSFELSCKVFFMIKSTEKMLGWMLKESKKPKLRWIEFPYLNSVRLLAADSERGSNSAADCALLTCLFRFFRNDDLWS